MTRFIHGFPLDNLRGDIYGGLTAAVVALPLALAFGVASGAGPLAGMYGAILVGFFAAIFWWDAIASLWSYGSDDRRHDRDYHAFCT